MGGRWAAAAGSGHPIEIDGGAPRSARAGGRAPQPTRRPAGALVSYLLAPYPALLELEDMDRVEVEGGAGGPRAGEAGGCCLTHTAALSARSCELGRRADDGPCRQPQLPARTGPTSPPPPCPCSRRRVVRRRSVIARSGCRIGDSFGGSVGGRSSKRVMDRSSNRDRAYAALPWTRRHSIDRRRYQLAGSCTYHRIMVRCDALHTTGEL
jgi:hypothetical protein